MQCSMLPSEYADAACAVLEDTLMTVDDRVVEPTGDDMPRLLRLDAQIRIGARVYRTIRAGRVVLDAGYEPEASVYARVLLELAVHRDAILADATGREAVAWVTAERGRGISTRVRAATGPELHAMLPHHAHGGPEPVLEMLESPLEGIYLGPVNTRLTDAMLIFYALSARRHADVIAELDGVPIDGMDAFDRELAEIWRTLAAVQP